MTADLAVFPKNQIRGGSAKTTRGMERLRGAYGFEGEQPMRSGDLGFRTFLRVREVKR